MIITLLSHLYKSYSRSSSFGKDMTVQIMLAFIVIALVGYSLALGIALEKIIVNTLEQDDAIGFLNGTLIYYFIGGFITRYMVQSLPVIDAQPYLHLPIPRSKIVHFLLGKSLVHIINISVFFLFTPFAFRVIAPEYGIAQAWIWLLSLWFISLINHFIVIIVKKKLAQSVWGVLTFTIVCSAIAAADYFGWLKLSFVSGQFFTGILQGYTVAGVVYLALILLYYSVYRIFIDRLYPEERSVRSNQANHLTNWTFLQRFGVIGYWIKVELKLIFRNKRPRELFILHVIFLLLAFAMYSYVKSETAYGTFLFIGLISSGFFTMNYGQFLFSWQGAHFDFTLNQPASVRQFIESKYWLLAFTVVAWFLFSIPFAYLGWQYVLVNLVASLYNVGVNIFVASNMSMWGAKTIDLKHPGSLNLEGMGAAQWLMAIPLMVTPYLFFIPFSVMGYPILGLMAVGMAGLIGILFRRNLIDITSKRLFDRRYTLASNFRKD